MTYTEIVNNVKSRMNLTSAEATARIGEFVNSRYRRVTSSLGLNTSRRAVVSANTVAEQDTLAFAVEKIELMYHEDDRQVMDELTYDAVRAMHVETPATGTPRVYAIMNAGSASVTVLLYPTPAEIAAITVDGLASVTTLSGTDVPAFPANFHDVLVFGAMADEYNKMEKITQSQMSEAQAAQMLSDLRYFLAKSAYLSVTQNSTGRLRRQRHTIVEPS